jgi:hypothetical protein
VSECGQTEVSEGSRGSIPLPFDTVKFRTPFWLAS